MDGAIIGEAALNAAAHLGEHFPDESEIVVVLVSIVMRREDGEFDSHTHTEFA